MRKHTHTHTPLLHSFLQLVFSFHLWDLWTESEDGTQVIRFIGKCLFQLHCLTLNKLNKKLMYLSACLYVCKHTM